jgi:hypothetical protein
MAGTTGSGRQHSGILKTDDGFRALSSNRGPVQLDPLRTIAFAISLPESGRSTLE